jgi:hypothetical protein
VVQNKVQGLFFEADLSGCDGGGKGRDNKNTTPKAMPR